jgi:hypothetical protein
MKVTPLSPTFIAVPFRDIPSVLRAAIRLRSLILGRSPRGPDGERVEFAERLK